MQNLLSISWLDKKFAMVGYIQGNVIFFVWLHHCNPHSRFKRIRNIPNWFQIQLLQHRGLIQNTKCKTSLILNLQQKPNLVFKPHHNSIQYL